MRARGQLRETRPTSLAIVAIVIVVHWLQPPVNGDSRFGSSGYGLWAYASSRACAARMPRSHAVGETPPVDPRGAVPPPATFAPAICAWIAVYAGLRRRVV